MRITVDPVDMLHRPLVWYSVCYSIIFLRCIDHWSWVFLDCSYCRHVYVPIPYFPRFQTLLTSWMELALFFSTPSHPLFSVPSCPWRSRYTILAPSSSVYNQATAGFLTWYRGMFFIYFLLYMTQIVYRFIDWIIPLHSLHPIHHQHRPRSWHRHPPPGITSDQYAHDTSIRTSSSSNASLAQYHPEIFTFYRSSYGMEPCGILGTFLWDFYCWMDCTRLCSFFLWRWSSSHRQNRSFGVGRSYTHSYIQPFCRTQLSLSRTMDDDDYIIVDLVSFLLCRFFLAIMVFRKSGCRCGSYPLSFLLLVRRWDVERRSGCFLERKKGKKKHFNRW